MLNELTLEMLYWYLYIGFPKYKTNIYKIRDNSFMGLKQPVFFLSTGRTGTKWFYNIIKKDKNTATFHTPNPSLAIQAARVYEFKNSIFDSDSPEFKLATEIFIAAREMYFVYCIKADKRFIETNNQLVFFAPHIAKLIPDAFFVHRCIVY